jgi:allatostatin receptor
MHKMQTLTNLLLLNLAVADLLFVLICPPFTAYEFAMLSWPFAGLLGKVLCKMMHYLLNVTAYVTIYTLVLIAALRYMTIVHSVATVRYRTKCVLGSLIIALWVVMMAANSPILWSYEVHINTYGWPDCENYRVDSGQRLYATFFVFAYLLPLTIIALLSIRIYVHINQLSSIEVPSHPGHKQHANKLLITVVVTFAILWFPIHIHLLMAYFGEVPTTDFYLVLGVIFYFLAYSNSWVNPIIYNFTCKDFRKSFKDALSCICRRETGCILHKENIEGHGKCNV